MTNVRMVRQVIQGVTGILEQIRAVGYYKRVLSITYEYVNDMYYYIHFIFYYLSFPRRFAQKFKPQLYHAIGLVFFWPGELLQTPHFPSLCNNSNWCVRYVK